jgi:histone H3/H4
MFTDPLIPLAPFRRLVSEILQDFKMVDLRLGDEVVEALRAAVEDYMVKVFKGTQLAAIHRKRVTISQRDMKLVRRFMEQQWDD